jgi:hypothetical protein
LYTGRGCKHEVLVVVRVLTVLAVLVLRVLAVLAAGATLLVLG